MAKENLTETNIESLAAQAASELLQTVPALRTASLIQQSVAISDALSVEHSSASRLKAALCGDSSFGALRNGWLVQRGGGTVPVQDHMLTHAFIRRAIDGQAVDSIVAEAHAFAASRTGVVESYTPLAGITVTKTVNLGDNIDLIPWADVPASQQKKAFGSDPAYLGRNLLTLTLSPGLRAAANSAIRVRSAEYQVLFESKEAARAKWEGSEHDPTTSTRRVQDVVRCLTAQSGSTAVAIGNWSQFDKKIANDICGVGYSTGSTLFDPATYIAYSSPVALDGDSLASLFRCFEKFNRSEKNVMRIALDRLSQALRRNNLTDKAIDLGIALEVMLLHGIGTNDRGELRFRSSIRGTTFLGGTRTERLKTLKILKDSYDLRSKAVHSGTLDVRDNGPELQKKLDDAANVCASIARKLIDRGSFPNWEEEYVVGGN